MIDREAWLQAIEERTVPDLHDDAMTMAEFAAMLGRSRTQAKVRMQALVNEGRARSVKKKIKDCRGWTQIVPAYLLVEKKK
jgi:predicted ArsR family transcriptional regulator